MGLSSREGGSSSANVCTQNLIVALPSELHSHREVSHVGVHGRVHAVCLWRVHSSDILSSDVDVNARALFIEGHGPRLYLEQEGVGVELSRNAVRDGRVGRRG